MKMKVICKDIIRKDSQESFNLDVLLYLNNKGVDYTQLTPLKQHTALFKVISLCNKCKVCRQGFITPQYKASPNLVFISRSSTKKDLETNCILNYKDTQAIVIKDICDIWGTSIKDIYYTNTSFCITKSHNDVTTTMCQRCYQYKDLELDTITLPKTIFLLGNDTFNSFYNMNCTVTNILGNIYYSYYKGDYRLFIPIPHPTILLREPQMYKSILNFVSIIKKAYDKNLMEELKNACNQR